MQAEFENGSYDCCQVVAWADEQWLAWSEAAQEDGHCMQEATLPLEISANDPDLQPVLVKLKKNLKRD